MLIFNAGQENEVAVRLLLESEPHGREYFDGADSLDELLASLKRLAEKCVAAAADDGIERFVGVAQRAHPYHNNAVALFAPPFAVFGLRFTIRRHRDSGARGTSSGVFSPPTRLEAVPMVRGTRLEKELRPLPPRDEQCWRRPIPVRPRSSCPRLRPRSRKRCVGAKP
jgi:hypothetical protein